MANKKKINDSKSLKISNSIEDSTVEMKASSQETLNESIPNDTSVNDTHVEVNEQKNATEVIQDTATQKDVPADTDSTVGPTTNSKVKSNKKEKKKSADQNNDFETKNELSQIDVEAKKISISKHLLDTTFIFILICTALMITFVGMTAKNEGIPSFAQYRVISYDTALKQNAVSAGIDQKSLDNYQYLQFIEKKDYAVNDIVAYKTIVTKDSVRILGSNIAKIVSISNDSVNLSNGETVGKNKLIGVYSKVLESTEVITFFLDKNVFIYLTFFPLILLTIVAIVSYFVLFPEKLKIKSLSKTMESVAEVTAEKDKVKKIISSEAINDDYLLNSVNHIQNMKQGNFELLRLPEGVTEIQNTNYYTLVASSGNEVYQRVEKFPETIALLQEIGAGDMDIIRVNMIGNNDFDKLLTTSRQKDKSLDLTEIITFLNNLPEISCIKKSGKINWTYKYKTKTVAIIREDVNDGYKISFKIYPDAAHKLNMVFMALEDSNFPSGPYWYMVNNLRNLPMNVLKWLIQESYRISKMQQLKADFVRTDAKLSKLVDLDQIVTNIKLYTELTIYDKFAIVVKNIENIDPKTTLLEDKSLKLKLENYNKEMYFQIQNNFAVSVLYDRRATDQLTTAFSYDLISALNDVDNKETSSDSRQTASTSKQQTSKNSTGVIRKVGNKR